jgi:hypothetical protein
MSRIGNAILNHIASGAELPPEDRTEVLAATLELTRKLGGLETVEDTLATALQAELGELDLDQYVNQVREKVGLKPRSPVQG